MVRGYLYGNATNNHEYAYVTATADNTVVRIDGGTTYNMSRGETKEFKISTTTNILTVESINGLSPAPVYVYHASGRGAQMAGAIIPTISVCTGHIVFLLIGQKESLGENIYFYPCAGMERWN